MLEECLAGGEGQGAQIVAGDGEQIEGEHLHRHRGGGALDVPGVDQPEPRLQALEGSGAALVERDELAVDGEVVARQMRGGGGDLGELRGDVTPAARPQLRRAAVAAQDEDADAVVLELEDPARRG